MDQPKHIIFINSHPIQYFAPLYKYLNEQGLKVSCWYCSDENMRGHYDRQFGRKVQWDLPLLEGYTYRFFKNRSLRPSLYNGFFGLFNPGLIAALRREPKSIVVHGWAYLTHLLVILTARMFGHTLCIRGESPLNQELMRSKGNKTFKNLFLKSFLFRFPNNFLFIGEQNRRFYLHYGVAGPKLVFTPYAVDNQRFQTAANEYHKDRPALRDELNLPKNSVVYLYSAKLIGKKRPMDLLKAYAKIADETTSLVMVGDGELMPEAKEFVKKNDIRSVYFPGFINQSEIGKYYAAADVFVLCSGVGETWGLSVNEAMNFGLPVIVTDVAGCSSDLVKENENGFVVPCGDIAALSGALKKAVALKESNTSREIVDRYSFRVIMDGLKSLT